MASDYTTGSASSFEDVLDALDTFLTANGWSATAGVGTNRIFSKDGVVMRLWSDDATPDAEGLYLIGATGISGSATTGDAAAAVKAGSLAPVAIVFPITYEFAINDAPDECYITLSYGGNKVQNLHFGQSDIPGIGGTGAWFCGSMHETLVDPKVYMNLTAQDASTFISGQSLGFFINNTSGPVSAYVHCELEGAASWKPMGANPVAGQILGQRHLAGLLMSMPSNFNQAEVLLPIYASLLRTDGTQTIVATMRHARFMRIDNVAPGDIITYGADQWKAYPLYAKNTAERNGVNWNIGADHSGTWGVALRYYGV